MKKSSGVLRRLGSERGGNAIEFAILLPLYITLTFGIIDFGWLFYHRSAVKAAAVDGCREGSLLDIGVQGANSGSVLTAAELRMDQKLDAMGVNVNGTANASLSGAAPELYIQCTYDLEVPSLLGLVVPASNDVTAGATFKLERQRYL